MKIKKVMAGQPFSFPAPAYNAFADAANANTAVKRTRERKQNRRYSGIVFVKNNTGAGLDKYSIVGLDGSIISHDDNDQEFLNRITLSGVTPTSNYAGKFAVLLQAVPDGAQCAAMVSGTVQVQINIINVNHKFADIGAETETENLESMPTGSSRILSDIAATGVQWCIVALQASGVPVIPDKSKNLVLTYESNATQAAWVELGDCP